MHRHCVYCCGRGWVSAGQFRWAGSVRAEMGTRGGSVAHPTTTPPSPALPAASALSHLTQSLQPRKSTPSPSERHINTRIYGRRRGRGGCWGAAPRAARLCGMVLTRHQAHQSGADFLSPHGGPGYSGPRAATPYCMDAIHGQTVSARQNSSRKAAIGRRRRGGARAVTRAVQQPATAAGCEFA